MTAEKRCPRCGDVFPRTPEFFNRNRSRADGLCTYCKPCHRYVVHEQYVRRMQRDGQRQWYTERKRMNYHLSLTKPAVKEYRSAVGAYKPPPKTHAGRMLDIEPFREWLLSRFPADWEHSEVAATLAMDEATVRRIRTGKVRRISIHIADRAFVNAGAPHMLAILFPLESAA